MREDGDVERKKEKDRGERRGGEGEKERLREKERKRREGRKGGRDMGVLQYYEQFCFRAQDYLDYIATNKMTMT